MFNLVGNLKHYIKKKEDYSIDLDQVKDGINTFDQHLIFKRNATINIYDRICDHAGGKIISKDDKHICPVHNWEFDPVKGMYRNGKKKNKIKYNVQNNKIFIENLIQTPKITQKGSNTKTKIRFFNHAFLQVVTKDYKFTTDPWALGPAFNTGWWLKHKTKDDWIKEINTSSFIYISYNHPDHLHPLTLSKVNKEIPIIVPNFSSNSTGIYIQSLGFKNIYRLDFAKEYQFKDTNLILSILKSGDFREDSGIYFSIGELTCLFDVDANIINFNKLPNVDVYASSFAGGASGYPLMYDNYAEKEQLKISKRDMLFIRNNKSLMLKKIKPKYFLPYAGFFEEKLERDNKIKNLNQKNKISDYEAICKTNLVEILNVEKNDEFYFEKNKLIEQKNNKTTFFKDISSNKYLKYYKKNYHEVDIEYIEQYFINSNFRDNLLLIVSLVNDDFSKSTLDFNVDFSKNRPIFKILSNFDYNKMINEKNNNKILYLKCRKESFLNTIYNKNPWEDLSIGFQCKVSRIPNEYNVKFWFHFTNKYITDKNIRFSTDCAKCEKITHYLDKYIVSQ